MTATRTDTRDLRDPQKLGEAMLAHMEYHKKSTMTYEWPGSALPIVPDVSHDDSMGKASVRAYRVELQARVEEGDRYAEAALRDIDAGKGVQGYDDAG